MSYSLGIPGTFVPAMDRCAALLSCGLLLGGAGMAQQPFLTHSDEPVWNVRRTLSGVGASTGTWTYSIDLFRNSAMPAQPSPLPLSKGEGAVEL